ncbi:GNAT family N-acetyltransferase [Sphingomonas sp. HF-S4]|uniref:GNAT family N-acetyltransferase n=1 Tax=Sphingomonas agrestis TaxID=3080540 RepID=A0ABU3YBY4_9SPHN|nr:GNAT family N-acetyltransferase [Sphingomonas sp. HF-S4]MDV3458652.1 GNAT family N-acetyltransferase [Sphingomonas sp. HF-S4]
MPLPLVEAAALGVALRPMCDADLAFTTALYASTRAQELAPVPWPEEAKQAFLAQQHAAQHAHYQQHYKGMDAAIVERGGTAIGRLYLYDMPGEVRIVDISLMPEARGLGLGGAMLRDVLAAAAGRSVTIHVEKNNPARTLYARLGFTILDDDRGAYHLWEWRAAP